jgi:glycine dehydrogenase
MFAQRSKKSNVNKFFVSEEILPQTLSVLQTRSEPIELVIGNHQEFDFQKNFFEQYFNIQENTVKL